MSRDRRVERGEGEVWRWERGEWRGERGEVCLLTSSRLSSLCGQFSDHIDHSPP